LPIPAPRPLAAQAVRPAAGMLLGPVLAATLLSAAALTALPVTPAFGATGCVSNAEYSKLAQGQRLRYIRRVAGDDAQIGLRFWSRGAYRYQERLYDMCTPWDRDHGTLTTRFMVYQGAWRAYVVDTHIGPED
jgi:hypothetical protein